MFADLAAKLFRDSNPRDFLKTKRLLANHLLTLNVRYLRLLS